MRSFIVYGEGQSGEDVLPKLVAELFVEDFSMI